MTAPWNKVPAGKGLYDRGNPSLYAAVGGSPQLARMYGCKWFALELASATREATARAARAQGFRVWGWTWPTYWRPDSWRRGLEILEHRGAALGVDGVIVDIEEWSTAGGWAHNRGELSRCLQAIGELAERMPTAVTTFPSWGGTDELLARAPGLVWVSPQCYGVRSGRPPAQVAGYAAAWRANSPVPVLPSLAAWEYSPEAYPAYLAAFSGDWRGVCFWTTGGSGLFTDPARVGAINTLDTTWSPWKKAGVALGVGAAVAGAVALSRGGVSA